MVTYAHIDSGAKCLAQTDLQWTALCITAADSIMHLQDCSEQRYAQTGM